MATRVDEYLRRLADLDKREREPECMSTSEELERLHQLNVLWETMTADERGLTELRLREKRVKDAS